jgi:hypothetical protein
VTTTAQDLITGALKFINVYAPGESLDDADAQDALQTLNLLLESWSTTEASVFKSVENILQFTPGQYEYTVGNYDAGEFAGTLTSGSPTITDVIVPEDMIANGDLTGVGIPAGTTIEEFDAGLGTITMSQNATLTPGSPLQIQYTIPGDFKIPRPLRVRQSFTRITTQASGLDYTITPIDEDTYNRIGYKGIAAPWPIVMWYNPTYPLGTLKFYQNPSQAGELHLFTDSILQSFSDLTEQVEMPQGYARAIKFALGRDLAPEYGAIWTPTMNSLYNEAYNFIKALNKTPTPVSTYDAQIVMPKTTDAGWILFGGFR